MSNMLEVGAAFLKDTLLEYASIPVTYRRGATQVSLNAVLGSSLLRVGTADVAYIMKTERDYYLSPDDMGALFPPQKDDEIVDAGTTWRVLHLPNMNVYDSEDQMGEMIRVFTKKRS